MSDLRKYITQRKNQDPEFADGYEVGYDHFKLGILLETKKSAVFSN